MLFDQYMYGKSNLILREALKINEYCTLGYFGSYSLLKDNWEKDIMTENQFYVALGPEDFKVAIGYDPIRKGVRVNYIMRLKGDQLDIPYEKMIVDDADTLGKKNTGKKKQPKSVL